VQNLKKRKPYKITFSWIKNLPRLVSSQLSKKEYEKFICDRCFYNTKLKEKFKSHKEFCDNYYKYEKALPKLPKQNILRIKNF
jgi:hypothetical protein